MSMLWLSNVKFVNFLKLSYVKNICLRYFLTCVLHNQIFNDILCDQFENIQVILPAAKSQFGLEGSLEELCRNDQVKSLILEDIQSVGKKSGLFSFEQVWFSDLNRIEIV